MNSTLHSLEALAYELDRHAEQALELQRPVGWVGSLLSCVATRVIYQPPSDPQTLEELTLLLQQMAERILPRLTARSDTDWPACWKFLHQPEVENAVPLAQCSVAWNCLVNYELPVVLSGIMRTRTTEGKAPTAAPEMACWLLCSAYQQHFRAERHRKPAYLLLQACRQVTPWRFFRFSFYRACQHGMGAAQHLSRANEAELPRLLSDLDHLACVLAKRIVQPGLPAGLIMKAMAPLIR